MKLTAMLFTLLFIMQAGTLSVYAVGGAEIKASVLRYEPTPAEQGNTVDVWVQLSNAGTKADKVAVRFIPEFPFSLLPGTPEEIMVGALAATENNVLKFTIFVDPSAPNGDKNITFQYKYASDQWIELKTPITIQTQDAILVVDDYKITPSPLVPGKIANLEMTLRNAGRIAIKNIDVDLDLLDTFSTLTTGAKQRIAYIPSGESETITFKLASDTSTEVKVYPVPVSLSYQDERNKEYTDTAKISLIVNAEPELSVTIDSTVFKNKKVPGTVSLKVVNKGIVNLKYVTVKLIQMPEYDILSTSHEAYIGNLDSDDFETVEFIIKPHTTQPPLAIQLEFKDPYNTDFLQQYTLPLRIITEKDLGKGGFPIWTILIVLLIISGVTYWYIKRHKKR